MFYDYSIRPGEVGEVIDIDLHLLSPTGGIIYDYIVLIRGRPLFFYEEELVSYPTKEGE